MVMGKMSSGVSVTAAAARRVRRAAVALSLSIALAGCGGHVKGVMEPLNLAEAPKGNAVVDMLVHAYTKEEVR